MTEVQAEIVDGALALESLKLKLAAQLAPPRWQRSLLLVAKHVDAGQPLEAAFDRQREQMPAELRSLVAESLRVPEPTALIIDALRARAKLGRNWRELKRLVAYPVILLGVALLVGVAFSFTMRSTLKLDWIEGLGLAGAEQALTLINDQHSSILGMAMIYAWLLMVLSTIAIVAPRWAWSSVMSGVMLIGRPLRWLALQEVLERFEMFTAQGLTPVVAAGAVARSFSSSSQAVTAVAVSERILAGMPLGQALCISMVSDGLTRPALRLLDLRSSEMPHALRETIEMLQLLIEQRCRALATALPVFLLVLVGSVVWMSLSTYLISFLPLVSLITSLS